MVNLYTRGAYKRGVNLWDVAILVVIAGVLLTIGRGLHEMRLPIDAIEKAEIYLAPSYLPEYALRTVLRMFIAVICSLIITIIYGTWAAKDKRAEHILIPILDIFQSVPVLGFLSFTVTGFIAMFPGSSMGLEAAVIFAAFTNQVPNMVFSFYQSLKTLPQDLVESCAIFKLSPVKKFFRLELPFATQGLIWNTMMSMSGGWFLIVASEAVTIGSDTISLPGIGSYIAKAIDKRDITSVLYSIVTMFIVILIYDQAIFRPLIVWADKFRYESSAGSIKPKSFVSNILGKSSFAPLIDLLDCIVKYTAIPVSFVYRRVMLPMMDVCYKIIATVVKPLPSILIDIVWYVMWLLILVDGVFKCYEFTKASINWSELLLVIKLGSYTLLRVTTMVIAAIVVWAPVGIYIGLRPKLSEKMAPIVQFAAAFPANFLFPFAVIVISRYHLNADIWLAPLMILGTQWYVLFNVIAGASAFPTDLKESSAIFHIKGKLWWRKVILPGILPYIITGAITASGGAWNASIVAEVVSWGDMHISASGLGTYITKASSSSDYHRIAIGIVVMSLYVIIVNRLVWRPLYRLAARKGQLN
jgi:NitT/TauT family transport system permease protein